MIHAIGIDLVDTARVGRMLERHGVRVLARLLTDRELTLFPGTQPAPASPGWSRQCEWLAGRVAAKEAVVKALGTGIGRGVRWRDVEVVSDPVPEVCLHGRAHAVLAAMNGGRILISITHERGLAAAVAVITGR